MKKKLFTMLAACALVLALPAMAFALDSPQVKPVDSNSISAGGVSVQISATAAQGSTISVANSTTAVSGVTGNVLASFSVSSTGSQFSGVSMSLTLDEQYAGRTVTVYLQMADGTVIPKTGVVDSKGQLTITADELFELVSVSVSASASDSSDSGKTVVDNNAKSPNTGSSTLPVACMTVAALAVAGACAVSLRKRED